MYYRFKWLQFAQIINIREEFHHTFEKYWLFDTALHYRKNRPRIVITGWFAEQIFGGGMDSGAKRKNRKALSSRSISALVSGVSRLVDGQKQFADEMGLPYARIFQDGFEAFKDAPVEEVILSWLDSGSGGHENIEQLFVDLLGHQMALVEALAEIRSQPPTRPASLQNLFGLFQSGGNHHTQASHRSYMEVTAPAFIAAYARAREQGRFDRPLMDSRSR